MLKSVFAMFVMKTSDWFMSLAVKTHDMAGNILGMTAEQKKLWPDTSIFWAMMRNIQNGTNLFTMHAIVEDPASEEWKKEVAVLPGEIVWLYSIAELRIQALQNYEAHKMQLKLMKKKDIVQ